MNVELNFCLFSFLRQPMHKDLSCLSQICLCGERYPTCKPYLYCLYEEVLKLIYSTKLVLLIHNKLLLAYLMGLGLKSKHTLHIFGHCTLSIKKYSMPWPLKLSSLVISHMDANPWTCVQVSSWAHIFFLTHRLGFKSLV